MYKINNLYELTDFCPLPRRCETDSCVQDSHAAKKIILLLAFVIYKLFFFGVDDDDGDAQHILWTIKLILDLVKISVTIPIRPVAFDALRVVGGGVWVWINLKFLRICTMHERTKKKIKTKTKINPERKSRHFHLFNKLTNYRAIAQTALFWISLKFAQFEYSLHILNLINEILREKFNYLWFNNK